MLLETLLSTSFPCSFSWTNHSITWPSPPLHFKNHVKHKKRCSPSKASLIINLHEIQYHTAIGIQGLAPYQFVEPKSLIFKISTPLPALDCLQQTSTFLSYHIWIPISTPLPALDCLQLLYSNVWETFWPPDFNTVTGIRLSATLCLGTSVAIGLTDHFLKTSPKNRFGGRFYTGAVNIWQVKRRQIFTDPYIQRPQIITPLFQFCRRQNFLLAFQRGGRYMLTAC